jgi:hypothetical protein
MPTNLIHIGLPKCASTTLQDRLFAPNEKFIYLGRIKNGYRDGETREVFERITFQDSLEYDADATASLLRSLCAKAAAPERPILVSAESLSVEGRADRRLIAERLHRLLAPAKILIVLRAQPAMLQSLYLNHLRASGQRVVAFEQWLEQTYGGVRFTDLHRVGLNYEPLVRIYEDVFGADNVVVVPFEQIKDEGSAFFRVLADLLDMSPADVNACFQTNVDNQRMSGRQLLALHIQDRLPSGTNLARLGRRVLPPAVYEPARRFVTGGRRVTSPQFSDRWQARIAATCAQGNARLALRKNIPLAALGYPFAPESGRPV